MKSVQDCLTNNFISLSQVLSKMFTLLVNAWSRQKKIPSWNEKELEIYLKNLFITGKTLWSDAHIYIYIFFFLHPQTSNVTQAKLKLLYHECNNPGNYSIRQPFDIRGCVEQTVSISIFISFIIETLKRSFSSKRIS